MTDELHEKKNNNNNSTLETKQASILQPKKKLDVHTKAN